jgi:glycosyltransferase involved in cell wall biosynthesis
MPWRLRIALRRMSARRIRRASQDDWPIDPSAFQPPQGWKGWPGGKKFALVLTHDVEGADGLAKCRQLAELELQFGVRSSFNFVPEGGYSASAELRHWLVDNGFEVGVHDLHHDGKLFSSRAGFSRKAGRINDYLRDWNAVGFRAGFMLRKLDWMHELAIEYDASTFDTDPFELQAEGAGMIFPYWVSPHGPSSRGGYVELPYTLPQDSTLFLVLREATNQIWLRKTDWIASHGGMALLNVHPDYLSFGDRKGPREYSANAYAHFLTYVSERYRDEVWNPLPKDLARWFRQSHGYASHSGEARDHIGHNYSKNLAGKRAAVLLYSTYPADPRPRRATETLIEAGMRVDVLCLADSPTDLLHETIAGADVFRIPLRHRRDSKLIYVLQYGRFLLAAFGFLLRNRARYRYDLVHVHNMPDILVFSALIPKLTGAKIILDLHDPMPELMMTIFGGRESSFGIWLLKRLECTSIWFSDAVITVNEACRKLFSNRSRSPGKVNVVMNAPDQKIFSFVDATQVRKSDRRFAMMYHGSLVERHGLDLAVHALAQIRSHIPAAELWIFGHQTPFLQRVLASGEANMLAGAVRYFGPKKLEDIAAAIRQADVGIIPNRRSVFTEINTPTRIFEYLSQGKPVIAPRSDGILDYFGPDDLVYFELGDAEDLARQMEYVYCNPEIVTERVRRGQRVYMKHCWANEKARFLTVVSRLLGAQIQPPVFTPEPLVTATTSE